MSELGKLFRRISLGPKPLENFTTAQLAFAINQDDSPMKRSLRAVDRNYHDVEWHPALAKFHVAVADIARITAKTQVALYRAEGLKLGYLDLVLTISDSQQRESELWVEVKVDALEGIDQLANYRKHAKAVALAARESGLDTPPPLIITLGRRRVSPSVPALRWSALVDAITSGPTLGDAWLHLREFLFEENIARRPVPMEAVDAGLAIDVIADVNQLLRERFNPNMGIVWKSDGLLRKSLVRSFTKYHELLTYGGPLRYGLIASGNAWDWAIVVTPENDQGVKLDRDEMLRDADTVGGLPQEWCRHTDRPEALERRKPLRELSDPKDIVTWFDLGLRQLQHAKILDPYFRGVATKLPVPPPLHRSLNLPI